MAPPEQSSSHTSNSRGWETACTGPIKVPPSPITRRPATKNKKGKRVSIELPNTKSDDDMSADFPQYCAFCDRQMIAANSSFLYCSTACRDRDTSKAASTGAHSHHVYTPSTPTQLQIDGYFPKPGRDIVPQRSPTAPSSPKFSIGDFSAPSRTTSSIRIDEDHDGEDLLDSGYISRNDSKTSLSHLFSSTAPSAGIPVTRHHRRHESEAAKYLRSFQQLSFYGEPTPRHSRPKPQSRNSTISLAPSLTHSRSPTPGTSPCSSSAASHSTLASLPLSLAHPRPLPSRVNPYSSSYGAKSISLITPTTAITSTTAPNANAYASPPTALHQSRSATNLPGFKSAPSVALNVGPKHDDLLNSLPRCQLEAGELRFEKRSMQFAERGALRPADASVKSLFAFKEMQAPPSH